MNRDTRDSRRASGDEGRGGSVDTVAEGTSAKLEKTFDPVHFEERWYSDLGGRGPFPAGRSVRFPPVRDGHPAAERDRTPPYRPRLRPDARGHPRALEADAAASRALGPRHRPCRDRDPDGDRARAREARDRPAATWAARSSSSGSGRGSATPKDTIQSQIRRLGALARLDARALHARPGPLARRAARVRDAVSRGSDLSRHAYVVNWCPRCGTAVSDLEVVHREVRREALPDSVRRLGRLLEARSSRRPGPRRCSATPPSRSIPTTRAPRRSGKDGDSADRRSRRFPSSRTRSSSTGSSAPASSRSRRRTTRTTSRPGKRHDLPADRRDRPGREDDRGGAAEYAGLDRFEARKQIVQSLEAEGRSRESKPIATRSDTASAATP